MAVIIFNYYANVSIYLIILLMIGNFIAVLSLCDSQ